MRLGYGTYGMPGVPVSDALTAVRKIGYDGVELCCLPGTPGDPARLDAAQRRAIRRQLGEVGLELPALMLSLDATAEDQSEALAVLRAACSLAHDLAAGDQPILVSTAGGCASQWDADRERVSDNIGAYAAVAAVEGLVFALEPHVGGVVHTPRQAEWIRSRIDSPALKFNYDESHFQLQGLDLRESAAVMAPHAVSTHMKDARGDAAHITFLLPGEGEFDYPAFFGILDRLGYGGYLTVEVSAMVWRRETYDPFAAARYSYRTLDSGLAAAGLDRG